MEHARKNRKIIFLIGLAVCMSVLMAPGVFAASKKAPDKVKNLKVTAYEKTCVLNWNASENATGYDIYMKRYNGKNEPYKKVARVRGASHTTYSKKKLVTGRKYGFYVIAYRKINGKFYYADRSLKKYATTGTLTPKSPTNLVAVSTSKTAILSWTKGTNATSYLVLQKVNGKFKKVKTVTKTTATVKGLKNGVTYTFRIQPVREAAGKRVKGKGVDVTIKVNPLKTQAEALVTRDVYKVQITETTTLNRLDGEGTMTLYAGSVVGVVWKNYQMGDTSNDHIPEYFVVDGVKVEGATGICTPIEELYTVHKTAYKPNVAEYFINVARAKDDPGSSYSETNWLLWINYYTQYCYVFKRANANSRWKHYATWETSTGEYGMTQTPRGDLEIVKKSLKYYFPKGGGAFGYWASHLTGEGNAIHGPRRYPNGDYIDPGEIGYPMSAGCCRLWDENAKFVYQNMDLGTRVLIL